MRQSFRSAYGDKPDCAEASEIFSILGKLIDKSFAYIKFNVLSLQSIANVCCS
nr:MAG TPA: hypothetical protein [Bacteriophage sp.]